MIADKSSTASDQSSSDYQFYERPGDNPAVSLLLQLSVFVIVGALLLVLAPEGPWSIRLLLIALVFVTLKRWAGVLVLMMVQGDLLLREGRRISPMNSFEAVLFVTVVVGVLMFVARSRRRLLEAARGSMIPQLTAMLSGPESEVNVSPPESAGVVAGRLLAAATRGLLMIVGCVTLARVILARLPKNRDLNGSLRQVVNLDPSMAAGAILIVSLIAVWAVVSEISWRQMTDAQARMYLRSSFVRAHYRDLRMIVMRRLKQRQKRIAEARTKNKDQIS
jgi:hypothetical protein